MGNGSGSGVRAPIILTQKALVPIGLVVVILGIFGQLGWSWHLADNERVRRETTRQEEIQSLRRDMTEITKLSKELRLKIEHIHRRLAADGIKETP